MGWSGYKYGINWYEENDCDGGLLDDRIVSIILNRDDRNNISEVELNRKPNGFNSNVYNYYIRFDEMTRKYYLVMTLSPSRRSTSSILTVIAESDILDKRIEKTVELPILIDATVGDVKIVVPTNIQKSQLTYKVDIKYKDSMQEEYKEYKGIDKTNNLYLSGYSPEEDKIYFKEHNGNPLEEEDIVFDKDNMLIEYGFLDYTYGGEWKRIDNVEIYKNEQGIWTSDVVMHPENYLEMHLDWYYSDDRMVDYIETNRLLPQDKIDAIRKANYEDIFSFEYKMKSALKFIPIVLGMIIIAIIVVRKIRKIY